MKSMFVYILNKYVKYLFSDNTLLRTTEREEQSQHSVAAFILFYKLLLDKTW